VYDDDEVYEWRVFRLSSLRTLPWKLIAVAVGIYGGLKLGRMIRSMRIRLETLEAILLDHPPRV
jgi:hypothetical protein